MNPPEAHADDLVFLGLELPSRAPCKATPPVSEEDRGFRISAPRRVGVSERVTVPICGVWQFGPEIAGLPSELWENTVVVVVDATHNRAHAVTLRDPTRIPVDPHAKLPPSDQDEGVPDVPGPVKRPSLTRGYYNFDLSQFVPLPSRPAVYYVFITFAQQQSNTVRVEAVAPAPRR